MLFGFLWMQLYNAKFGWSLEAYDAWSRWREAEPAGSRNSSCRLNRRGGAHSSPFGELARATESSSRALCSPLIRSQRRGLFAKLSVIAFRTSVIQFCGLLSHTVHLSGRSHQNPQGS